ncbi:MAG: DNA repair protein RecN [Oscillospiraceae bacterium]|nr:DNA repair protein RecN [Oscillospiraceae bacterium]
MLDLLHIENIAVIEQADIRFGSGFNVLTGETGAGKSIVIDAISAILGERAYRDVIRTGSQKARVSALFVSVPELPWFEENGVPFDARELLIQREIYLDGKNVCRVNGQPVTVSILKKLGSQLINIHGQHDSQQLFDEANHLVYLDLFAQNQDVYSDYVEKFERVEQIRREIKRLSMDEGEKLRRLETLQFQIQEIERAELQSGEDEALESRRKVLQNSEKLVDGLVRAVSALYGDDERDGAAGLVSEAQHALSRITRYDDQLGAIYERLSELAYSVQDAAEELRDRMDELSYSGDELEQIESRLDVIHRLRRKYGSDVDAILSYLDRARQELDEIEFASDKIEKLTKQLETLENEAQKAGMALRKSRQNAAKELEQRLSVELAALDMPRAQFVCQFQEQSMAPNGMDNVCFLMTANIGEALKPMSKVASGGELARIMLAIKNVLAEQDHVGTLIFDEVDAGVSGRAAQKVAEKLRAVSKGKQVLCVTHLPQIAAAANNHLLIAKSERDGRTYTQVTTLDREGRKREIARIIGGAEITEITLQSAEEMLAE